MSKVYFDDVVNAVENLVHACSSLTPSCESALACALKRETNANAKFALETIVSNNELAIREDLPVCQDTGMAVFFVEYGQEVNFVGGDFEDAINEGVRRGYKKYGYRASVLDPIDRKNTGDNTPAVVHTRIVKGADVKISFMAKGFGSENMSRLYMLTPSKGIEGVKNAVLDAVKQAGSNPCPPIVVGVGIGGTAEKAMQIAKEELLRDVGEPNKDKVLADLEKELLESINALEIGAQGFGGNNTALAVHIGKYPTHISALPVAVNIQCHAVRCASCRLEGKA
ncbi:MAG: fumarate hydratase [Clostridia bacterium]|nr:fumarate hydratase [Clostridia bacterium]